MRPAECEGELLRCLAAMPFLDRLEMVAVSGRSRGAVYEAVGKLEEACLTASVPHAAPFIPPTRRYCLTAAGLHRLARDEGLTVDELLRDCPVSEQRRRVLMERLDALAVVYRVACAVSNFAYPIRFRWYRAMPMDAAIMLPDGRTVAVVRQGPTADRTAFSKRMWRLRDAFRSKRRPHDYARRDQATTRPQAHVRCALHRLPGPGERSGLVRVKRSHLVPAIRTGQARPSDSAGPHEAESCAWPAEKPPERASLPTSIDVNRFGAGGPQSHAARDSEGDREARPGPYLRLAVDHAFPPRRDAGGEAFEAVAGAATAGRIWDSSSFSRSRVAAGWRSTTGGWLYAGTQGPLRCWRVQEAVERRTD